MKLITVKLDKLVYAAGVPPKKSFVDSVRGQMCDNCPSGVRKPIWVEDWLHLHPDTGTGLYYVRDGRRRVQAVKQIGEIDEIPAMLIENGDGALFTLISQFHRSDNPIAEARALLALREEKGWDEKEIAKNLSMSLNWVRGRLELLAKLDPRLVEKVEAGTMPVSAARRAVNLDVQTQGELAERERVTIKDVEAMRRAQRLELLNLDTIEVPAGSNFAILATQIQLVANRFNGDKRKTLLAAARILEGVKK